MKMRVIVELSRIHERKGDGIVSCLRLLVSLMRSRQELKCFTRTEMFYDKLFKKKKIYNIQGTTLKLQVTYPLFNVFMEVDEHTSLVSASRLLCVNSNEQTTSIYFDGLSLI